MVVLKSPKEIEKIRESNQIVAKILSVLQSEVKPGIDTLYLDNLAEELARENNATPAFKGYRGFPYSLCASVNEAVVHGFPSKRKLKEGDILSMDFGVLFGGYFGDSALTVGVGKVSESASRLMNVTEQALYKGIEKAVVNGRLSDISHAVQKHVEDAGFSVVRIFVGHGIGSGLHEDPQIPNFGKPNRGPALKHGMTLAIEPMVNMGRSDVEIAENGWTVKTVDRLPSAHFEHTVLVGGKTGAEILT